MESETEPRCIPCEDCDGHGCARCNGGVVYLRSESDPKPNAPTAMEIDLAIRDYFKDGYVGVHRFCGVDNARQPAHIIDSARLFVLIEQNKKLLETADTCICSWCGMVGDKDLERIQRHMGECTARQDGYESQKRADDARVNAAASIAMRYGMVDELHHKQWVIDQMLRAMLGEVVYAKWIEDCNNDEVITAGHTPWDEGVAP